jgi:hypothetical protein
MHMALSEIKGRQRGFEIARRRRVRLTPVADYQGLLLTTHCS